MLLGRIDYREEGVAINYRDDNFHLHDLQDIPTMPYEIKLESGVLTVRYELFDDNPSDPFSQYKLLENHYIVDEEVPIYGFARVLIDMSRFYTVSPSVYFASLVGIANLQKPIITITIDMKVDNVFLAIEPKYKNEYDNQTTRLIFPYSMYSMIEYHFNGVDLSSLPYSYTDWKEEYPLDPVEDRFGNLILFEDLPIFNPPAGYEGFFLFGRCALSYNPRQDLYYFNNLEFESFDPNEWSGYIFSRFFLKQRREMYIPAPYIACNGEVSVTYYGYGNFSVPQSIKLDTNNKTSYWLSWSDHFSNPSKSKFFLEYVYNYNLGTGTINSNWKFYQNSDEDIATIGGVIQPLHTTLWYCRTNANDYIYDFLTPMELGYRTNDIPNLLTAANELANMVNSAYSANFVADDFLPYGASALDQLKLPPAVSGFDIDAVAPPSQYFVSLYRQAPYPVSTQTTWGGVTVPSTGYIRHGTIFPQIDFHPVYGSSLSFSPNEMPEGRIVVYTCQYDNSGKYTYGFLESQILQGFDVGKWEIIKTLAAQYGEVKELKFTVLDFDVLT